MRRWFACFVALMVSAAAASQRGVAFSELMFWPRSGEPEWVELHNVSDVALRLSDYALARVYADSVGAYYALPDYFVAPRGYVVLTKNREAVEAAYKVACRDCLLQCSQLPALPNGGASLALLGLDSAVVERVDYTSAMHNKVLRSVAGVSLERKSFERSASEPDNWTSASATAGYATPTAKNSQQGSGNETDFVVRLSRSVVCPLSDEGDDMVGMTYENGHDGVLATVVVFDGQGKAVKKLIDNAVIGARGTIMWDGCNDAGKACATGRYIVVFSLHDGRSWSRKIKKVVAVRR